MSSKHSYMDIYMDIYMVLTALGLVTIVIPNYTHSIGRFLSPFSVDICSTTVQTQLAVITNSQLVANMVLHGSEKRFNMYKQTISNVAKQ